VDNPPIRQAIQALEQMVSPFVVQKRYDVLLTLEAQGVDLIHALAAATHRGRHEQVDWLLARGVKPNDRVLYLAMLKGRQMTDRILAHTSFAPEHADTAALMGDAALLERAIDAGALPTKESYVTMRTLDARHLRRELMDVIVQRGEIWRHGTRALLNTMHLVTAQHVSQVISIAPSRFNREKLLARAIRCNPAATSEIVNYGFGTKVTARVALNALSARVKGAQSFNPMYVADRLVQLHRESRSEPLSAMATCRVLRRLIGAYIDTYYGSEQFRDQRSSQFKQIFESVLQMSRPEVRSTVLEGVMKDFAVDSVASEPAKRIERQRDMWPDAYRGYSQFKIEFASYVQRDLDACRDVELDQSPVFEPS